MDTTQDITRLISFCTGLRGIERGIEPVFRNLITVCAVEIESVIIENLVAEMEAGMVAPHPVWTDLKTFPAHKFRGLVDIITGGFPCTPFSLAGKRQGSDDPRHLWPFIRRHVKAIEPRICYFENVDDLLTLGFDTVYKDLHEMGYAVEAGVFSAAEVGAPHERQRVFILAIHHSYRDRLRQEHKISAGRNSAELAGEELADTEIRKDNRREPGFMGDASKGGKRINSTIEPGSEVGDSEITKCQCGKYSWRRILGFTDPGDLADRREGLSTSLPSSTKRNGRTILGKDGGGGKEGLQTSDWEAMADTDFCRQQQWVDAGMGRVRKSLALRHATSQGSQKCGNFRVYSEQELQTPKRTGRFPAGPGEPQHSWEQPRTITREAEPEMGLTVDGFRFREDILRGLGNAVVPAQSHKAFMTLWNKHFS